MFLQNLNQFHVLNTGILSKNGKRLYLTQKKITQKSLRKRKRKKIAQKSERLITANSEPWRLFKSSFSCCSYPYSATFLKILSGFKSCCSEGDAWVHPGLECGSTSPPILFKHQLKTPKSRVQRETLTSQQYRVLMLVYAISAIAWLGYSALP